MDIQQQLFCEVYALGLDAATAAIFADYDAHTASSISQELLALSEIQEEITRLKERNAAEAAAILADMQRMIDGISISP